MRDIHHRIDSLKEENERQYNSLAEKLHALEVAIAVGTRFPAAAWISAAALFLTVVGSGFVTYHKLETAQTNSAKAITLIERHMEGSGERFATIRSVTAVTEQWERILPSMEERLKGLEGRIVGQGPNGWHRSDHDLYAKMMDERVDSLKRRIEVIENKQEQLCNRVRECRPTK